MKENTVKEKFNLKKEVFDWLEVIVTAVIAVVIIFTFIFRVATIKGDSMQNTLFENEKVIITNWLYEPQYGDIVVISRNADNTPSAEEAKSPIIKRVIATENQTVNIDFTTGIVTVDGVILDEPYIKDLTLRQGDIQFPVRVPEGHIFCLGDNRMESLDSRYSEIGEYGMIDTRYVLGKVQLRIYPLSKIGRVD